MCHFECTTIWQDNDQHNQDHRNNFFCIVLAKSILSLHILNEDRLRISDTQCVLMRFLISKFVGYIFLRSVLPTISLKLDWNDKQNLIRFIEHKSGIDCILVLNHW
jgi:hypothetical protein